MVSPSGISSTTLDSWTKDGEAVGHREVPNGRAADGGVEVSEKLKLERMFKQMARKIAHFWTDKYYEYAAAA